MGQLENAVLSQHNTIKKLVSETLALRAFALAVLEQPGINLGLLRDEFVERWEQAVRQVPPEMQDKEQLQKLLIEIEHVLNRPGRDGA
ncbi:hypothetical protein [Methylomonas rapida]|uniref:Uncharacterized protein n=1 Tax=Methylomonas rapida TaxID=2963939 RepID=A0ABY7GFP5_9GAMM|nr:hypothetical protein [Methylomonas rapida]WAR42940.1 hypothetical protein NM686_011050 [Methylomonas rapida]